MTLKELVYKILLDKPETRDSRKLLYWEVLKSKGYVHKHESGNEYIFMPKELFMNLNPESVRRCSQQLQRSDLLTGAKLIQPSPKIKKQRQILANENGFAYISGTMPIFNKEKGVYEI